MQKDADPIVKNKAAEAARQPAVIEQILKPTKQLQVQKDADPIVKDEAARQPAVIEQILKATKQRAPLEQTPTTNRLTLSPEDQRVEDIWARHPDMKGRNQKGKSNLNLAYDKVKAELDDLKKLKGPEAIRNLFNGDNNATHEALVAAQQRQTQVSQNLLTVQTKLKEHLNQREVFSRMSGLMRGDTKRNEMESQIAVLTVQKVQAGQQIRKYEDHYQQKLKPEYEKKIAQGVKKLEGLMAEMMWVGTAFTKRWNEERAREERARPPLKEQKSKPKSKRHRRSTVRASEKDLGRD